MGWKQDKPSVADLFFAKIRDVGAGNTGEDAISLFYEMGVEYLDRHEYDEAKKWLERAYTILQQYDWRSTFDGPELRLNVLHAYTRSLFALDEHGEAARDVLANLHTEYPQRLPVSLLRMEHYADVEELRTTLEATMQSMQLMGSNFQVVMHHAHILCKLNVRFACKAMEDFILKRLIPENVSDWIETFTLTLIWMITQDHNTYGTPENLVEALSLLWQAGVKPPLSSESSQSAIVLVWKRIEQAYETDFQLAVNWCKAAIMFARQADISGVHYGDKLNRKLVACCVAAEDYAGARDALDKLSDDAKVHPLSRYLAYMVAMRNNDEAMAERALSSVASAPKDAEKLLFACVAETDRYGNPKMQAKLLQRILDKYSNEPHPDVNISALLRATARLLWQVLEQEKDNVDEEILERLCAVFKAAKNYSIKCNGDPVSGQSFGAFECEWFSKNGYNLVLQMMQRWPTRYILRVLDNIAYLKYPEVIPIDTREQHLQRNKKTAYVRIILYTAEARNGDKVAYTKVMTIYNNSVITVEYDQFFAPLLPLIFEAALHSTLEDRHRTLNHLLASLNLDSPKSYAACADMVLVGAMASDETHLPVDTAVTLLNSIISQVRTLEGYDIKQASRWIRCVVQLIIDTSVRNVGEENAAAGPSILRDVLDEAAQIVQDTRYPSEELEWLATTAFNLAVDLYVAEKDDDGREMALRALVFADAMADKGFAMMLRDKMRKIGWC